MSCIDCSSGQPSQVYSLQYKYNSSCNSNCCTPLTDSKCISYKGVPLACSGIDTDDTIEEAIQKIDALVCQTSGDYSTYNTNCLTGITTQAEFVDDVTSYICTLNTTVDTFISTTFPAYQTTVTNSIASSLAPAITCSSASVTSADSTSTVLSKYCTKFTDIDSKLDISNVIWNTCFSVGSSPASIAEGFSLLSNQICQVKTSSSSVTLPTFNNVGSCLSITGAADTLVDTVNALRVRTCLSPVFDINSLTWGCITKPSSVSTNLQAAFQSVLTKIDSLSQGRSAVYSSDFVVTNVDDSNLCLGKNIALATPLNLDRYVASNSSDSTPGTLIDKLQGGTNVTLDDTTTPGKVIVNVSGMASDGKVYANSVDDTLGFLDEKIEGSTGDDINISASYDATNKQVKIFGSLVNKSDFILSLFDVIKNDPDIYEAFCALKDGCPSPCQPPQNVQATDITDDTTTTTTSTTTSTTTTSTTTTTLA